MKTILNNFFPQDVTDLQRARQAWSLRVQRIGSLFQGAFAGFWLARGALATPFWWRSTLAWACVLAAATVIAVGLATTRRNHPGAGRAGPSGKHARRLERKVTIATVIQLVASFALPALVAALGYPSLILAAVVVSVGPLLLYFWYLLGTPRYGFVGAAFTIGPFLLILEFHGNTLTAITGLMAGALALGTAILSLRDVAMTAPRKVVP